MLEGRQVQMHMWSDRGHSGGEGIMLMSGPCVSAGSGMEAVRASHRLHQWRALQLASSSLSPESVSAGY